MKTPIIAYEHGDIIFFETLKDVTAYIEPIDVENKEYELFDAVGNVLAAVPTKPNITINKPIQKNNKPEYLMYRLREFYKKLGLEEGWVNSASLEELVAHGAENYATK